MTCERISEQWRPFPWQGAAHRASKELPQWSRRTLRSKRRPVQHVPKHHRIFPLSQFRPGNGLESSQYPSKFSLSSCYSHDPAHIGSGWQVTVFRQCLDLHCFNTYWGSIPPVMDATFDLNAPPEAIQNFFHHLFRHDAGDCLWIKIVFYSNLDPTRRIRNGF